MNTYRVEVTSYIKRRMSNLAVDVIAPDALSAARLGVWEALYLWDAQDSFALKVADSDITSIDCQLIGEA